MMRKVERTDAAAITAIYNHYVLHSVATFDTDPVSESAMWEKVSQIAAKYPCWVEEEAGEVIGYCYAHPWKEKAAYQTTLETTIYLSPEYTGKSIGRRMMEHLIADCRERGFHALVACITADNVGSCHLHEQLGFRKVSHFEQVGQKFHRWLDVVDYELLL